MQKGDIVEKYKKQYELISYIRDATTEIKKTKSRVKMVVSNNQGIWAFEYWLCKRISDNNQVVLSIQKPLEKIIDDREHCDQGYDRLPGQYINDKWEVNLLTDSYEEWISNQRNLSLKDCFLEKKNKQLLDMIEFLGDKWFRESKNNNRSPLKIGYKLLYYHRQCPTWTGCQVFKRWCADNPVYHEKMKRIINEWVKTKEK